MAPLIVLIRHAQALHNIYTSPLINVRDGSIHDPPLSDLGVQQCVALRQSLKDRFSDIPLDQIVILSSPMRRTLQTAMLSVDWLVDQGVKIQANADWQENPDKPCDTGSPVSLVAPDFPQVDFSAVDPAWPDKSAGSPYAYSRSAILERGQRAVKGLSKYADQQVVLVFSHSGFLRAGITGRWYFNSDYRVFRLGNGLEEDGSTEKGGLGLSSAERVGLGSGLPEP